MMLLKLYTNHYFNLFCHLIKSGTIQLLKIGKSIRYVVY